MGQLESIQKRLRGLALKRPSLALALHGEAGIGKTHAVKTLLQSAPCAHLSLHATVTLATLLQTLPRPRASPAWVDAITTKLQRSEFGEDAVLLGAIAARLSGNAPFILHLEDIHEVSPERLEWLGKLGNAVRCGRGVALIVTSRQPPPEPFEATRLEPLSEDQTCALLEGEIGAPLPPEAVTWIHGRAAGNPLFTLEFFRHLARQGFVWNDARRWHWRSPPADTLPVTVEALIERLLLEAADTPSLEAVLEASSLLPDDASIELWAAVANTPRETIVHAISKLRSEGIFASGGFVHPLYREIVRGRLNALGTEQYARRAIAWLRETRPEQAIEFIELAHLEPQEACELFDAGIRNLRALQHEVEAARLLRRSLSFRDEQHRPQVALEALRVLHEVDFTLASELLEIALSVTALKPSDIAFLSEQLAQRGRETDALRLLGGLDESERSAEHLLEWRTRFAALSGKTSAVLELVNAHPELLESRQAGVVQALVHILAPTGRGAEALQIGLRGLELELKSSERVGLLPTTATAYFYQGRYAEAVQLWSQAIELGLANQLHTTAMKATISRAQALIRIGEKAQAEADLEQGSKLAREFGDRRIYLQSLVLLGVVLTERGEFERAEEKLLEGLSVFSEDVFPDLRLNAEMALTELYRVWPSPHAPILMHKYARQVFQHAQELGNIIFTLNAYLALSGAELRIGNARRALELANEALSLGRQHGRQFQTMSALRVRAEALEGLNDKVSALESWREAITAAETLNLPLIVQECRLEAYRLTGDANGAQDCLTWFEANGHPLEAANARRYFPRLDAIPAAIESVELPKLEVLGSMQITTHHPEAIRGRKRQELLAALLETRIAGKSEITRLELLDALYPDEDEDRATSSLKELVRSTRASLGVQTIQTTANGYALGAVNSDAEEFLKTGNTALWRGAYLNGSASKDDAVHESLHLALSLQAEQRLETDPKEAARVGRLLLEHDAYNLAYLRLTAKALRANDNHKSLTRLYAEARDRMSEVGETLPQRWQDFLLKGATA